MTSQPKIVSVQVEIAIEEVVTVIEILRETYPTTTDDVLFGLAGHIISTASRKATHGTLLDIEGRLETIAESSEDQSGSLAGINDRIDSLVNSSTEVGKQIKFASGNMS